jgi:hypothetical protein
MVVTLEFVRNMTVISVEITEFQGIIGKWQNQGSPPALAAKIEFWEKQ